MGTINSKSTASYQNLFPTKNQNRSTNFPTRQSVLSCCSTKQHLCLKKKILLLGLDGAGKTDLFQHLISNDKQNLKIEPLPKPTLGKNSFSSSIHFVIRFRRL